MGTCSEKRVVNLEPAWKFDKIRCEQNEKGNNKKGCNEGVVLILE